MNKKTILYVFFIVNLFHLEYVHSSYDVNLIGFLNEIKSISRHTSSFIDCLPQDLSIKLFKTKMCSPKDFKVRHRKILEDSINLNNQAKISHDVRKGLSLSGVTIYTDSQWYDNSWSNYKLIPNKSSVKYAYCVTERTEIPKWLAFKFNTEFDAIIVVDKWLINVCKNSGVTIPVFTLPLALNLNTLLSKKTKKSPSKPFAFGFSGGFWPRKNHELLIRAFDAEFRNDTNVRLIMHGRFEQKFESIQKMINHKSKNIKIIQRGFSRNEYENFIASLDCYVILSKGEGFSITPREALAAGIPCIISNNTAHKTICREKFVYAVPSNIIEPSFCRTENAYLGKEFNCNIKNVRKALRNVYEHYQFHYERAQRGRRWVQQYLPENLAPKYLNLVKPKKVIFGSANEITDDYLMTNSETLFNKYRELCKSTKTIFEIVRSKTH